MAHSAPRQGIANRGDYERWQMAAKALMVFMKVYDPRVTDAWNGWIVARQIPAWNLRLKQEEQAGQVTDETIAGLTRALGHYDDPGDIEPFERLVHDVIGLPYRWVPKFLRMEFAAWTHTAIGWKRVLVPTVEGLPADFPIGKAPRAGGADIARNVGWLYQVRYWPLEQRRSIKFLAKAWDQEHRAGQRNVDSRKLIREGMKQADALLDLARW